MWPMTACGHRSRARARVRALSHCETSWARFRATATASLSRHGGGTLAMRADCSELCLRPTTRGKSHWRIPRRRHGEGSQNAARRRQSNQRCYSSRTHTACDGRARRLRGAPARCRHRRKRRQRRPDHAIEALGRWREGGLPAWAGESLRRSGLVGNRSILPAAPPALPRTVGPEPSASRARQIEGCNRAIGRGVEPLARGLPARASFEARGVFRARRRAWPRSTTRRPRDTQPLCATC